MVDRLKSTMRSILHVDMDAFYASVEQLDHPEYKGRPVIVGADPKGGTGRGVVAACSYEARKFGVRSALPISRAWKLCPDGVYVRPRMKRYVEVSGQIMQVFRRYTDLVEPLSIDEAFLDITGSIALFGPPEQIARSIKNEIREQTGLTASVGLAPNKFLAKIASGWQKPDGLTVVAPERVEHFLQGLPVDALWGVGPVTARKLRAHGVEKLVDVRSADLEGLRSIVGSLAEWLKQLAQGIDDRPVVADYEVKSSGSENTFATDLRDIAEIREEIESMARGTARWLAKRDLYARTVTIKVRYNDFTTITRSHTEPACRDEDAIVRRAIALLERTEAGRRPIRLLGVSVHNLSETTVVVPEGPPRLPFED